MACPDMVGSRIVRQRMSAASAFTVMRRDNANNSSTYSQPECYPEKADRNDYEIQVHVNFQTREMRLLKVAGAPEEADVFIFTREKCRQDCSSETCTSCRTRKLYQDKADNPQGTVPYCPHQEYLYCLRFGREPITALLSLVPREQDVEVTEKGLLAYWFMKWLERAKVLNPEGGVADIRRLQATALGGRSGESFGSPPPSSPRQADEPEERPDEPVRPSGPPQCPPQEEQSPTSPSSAAADDDECLAEYSIDQREATSEDCLHKSTSTYLPNMQVIYQVKKDQMSVVLPKPEQLTRSIDLILQTVSTDGQGKQQSIQLTPGATQSSNSLVALRNTPYTLQVQLHDKGRPVDLLDFITEHKILRVQESKDAPKQLNFLMERLIEQRGTFVLHITFDEKIVEVGTKPVGEFYLDVDVDSHRMTIGTINSHAEKFYRVEKITKQVGSNVLLAEKQLIFEGGVDPNTLMIKDSIPIERMSDYVITVVDPVTKQYLPTSVLAFHKHALFVKEIKNSEVRLHVTVQRQPSITQSSNANNLLAVPLPVIPIRRENPATAFHCPFRSGWTAFRIHHSTTGSWMEPPNETSYETTPLTTSTAETATVSRSAEATFSLDVDLPQLKARLVPISGCRSCDSGTVATSSVSPSGTMFVVYEECLDGRLRSTPCQLNQAFKIRQWCKYTVKCVDGLSLTPLLNFCVTDKEVTDIRPCSSNVHLSKRLVKGTA